MRPPKAGALAAIAGVLAGAEASAGLPEMEDLLRGRARADYFADCSQSSVNGSACTTAICGKDVAVAQALGPAPNPRNVTVDGTAYNVHGGSNQDEAVADLLNALCTDSFDVGGSSIVVQHAMLLDFSSRAAEARYLVPGPLLKVGGAVELGSSNVGGVVPVAYARNLTDTQFVNFNGALSYSSRPQASQIGFAGTPSYGMLVEGRKVSYGLGGYVPLALAVASMSALDESVASYVLGLGGIGTVTALWGKTEISGGFAFAGRATNGGGTVPLSAVARGVYPITILVDAYASAAYSQDPLHAGTRLVSIGLGAAIGDLEVGYQGFFTQGYTGHLLGATWRKDLRGSFALERPSKSEEGTTVGAPDLE